MLSRDVCSTEKDRAHADNRTAADPDSEQKMNFMYLEIMNHDTRPSTGHDPRTLLASFRFEPLISGASDNSFDVLSDNSSS
jgi:hypothetical protein